MSLINKAYINAILADASYEISKLKPDYTIQDLFKLLTERMTQSLATYIVENYRVVTYIDSSDYLNSGFDATVWKNVSTGEVYVSMKGTDGAMDIINDLDLTTDGAASGQIIDMVNWWLRNTASVGEYAMQIGYVGTALVQMSPVAGTGLLSDVSNVTVNGHSLGGHLATAFTRIFGQQWPVEHTYTYNSAGFLPESELFFSQIQGLLGDETGLEGFPDETEQSNFFAMNGINVTTRTLFNNQEGMRIPLFNEESGGVFTYRNHFMEKLTDTLAIANTISQLDPSFDFEKMNALFSSVSSEDDRSLETMLNELQEVILGTSSPITDREDFHRSLVDLASTEEFAHWSGKLGFFPLVDTDIDGNQSAREVSRIISSASMDNDLGRAYRHALAGLQPFVILGDPEIPAAVYSGAQTELYDEVSAPDGMTGMYLADRATMLHILVSRNLADVSTSLSSPYGNNDTTYEDMASETLFTTNPLTGDVTQLRSYDQQMNRQVVFGRYENDSGSDALHGGQKDDHIYGLGGNDEIFGHDGNDYIEGNAGDDRINGGMGDDELVGGAGHDYYRYEANSGHDVIRDVNENNGLKSGLINHFSASGDVVTVINGGVRKAGAETWNSVDGNVSYILGGMSGNDLLISFQGEEGSILVPEFSDGDLGITLTTVAAYAVPVTSNDIIGDANGPTTNEYLHGSTGNDYIYGGYGYDVLIGNDGHDVLEGGDHSDELLGGTGNDLLMGGNGNDVLQGEAGLDHLQGDAGDDRLFSWNAYLYGEDEVLAEGDILEGGSGSDVLQGSTGNDQLYAGVQSDLDQALNSDLLPASSSVRDFLSGGDGNDLLVGGSGHDFLGGANGDDYLVGGAGDDIILGDYELRTNSLDWDVFQSNIYYFNYTNVSRHSVAGTGNDVVHAGGGNDLVHGDRGDDVIYGNAGQDILRGGDGEDYLYGGAGSDRLLGENHNDVIHGGSGNDELSGQGGNDYLSGNDGDDRLYGHSGNDTLYGGDGADYLRGYAGNDSCYGGLGNDYYHIYAVDGGIDHIQDEGGNDVVQVSDASVTYDTIDVTRSGNGLVIKLNATDSITVDDWFLGSEYQIETFRLYTTAYTGEEIESLAFRPRLVNPVSDAVIDQGDGYTLELADDMFTDIDDEQLNISITRVDGSDIPSWLSFDETTRTLSGIPQNEDVGTVDMRVTATDAGGQSASDDFTLVINNINDAPVLMNVVEDQFAAEDRYFSYLIEPNTFHDADKMHGDALSVTLSQADGTALPEWLHYDPATNHLSGTPGNEEVGSYDLIITASDLAGESVSDQFSLDVANVNDAPVFVDNLPDQSTVIGSVYQYVIDSTVLHDEDVIHGDQLTLSVMLADGTALPGWLGFQSADWTFTGTPGAQDTGILDIQLSATDQSGASTSNSFSLLVQADTDINQSGSREDDILTGGIYSDSLRGGGGNDRILGGDAADTLTGGNGHDELVGGNGDDILKGSADNDVLAGESGNDLLYGGRHNDRYHFGITGGQDVIYDSHGEDVLIFDEGVDIHDIWFSQAGNDLKISLLDTHDQVVIDGWYKNTNNQVERFETESGLFLMNDQVAQLVQAMSVFDPVQPGEFNPDPKIQEQAELTIASAWSAA